MKTCSGESTRNIRGVEKGTTAGVASGFAGIPAPLTGELSEREKFAEKVLDASLSGVYVYDVKQGKNRYINKIYTRLTGYAAGDIDAMNRERFFALFHPDDRPRVADHMNQLASGGDDMREIEYRFKVKDGRWLWFFSRDCVFSRGVDGTVSEFIGTFIDITDRKKYEQALAHSERNYRELVQNANSAIIRWKRDGTISFFNEYAQSLFGYTAQEVLGRKVDILLPEESSTGARLTSLVQDIVNHPERYISNINENIRRDGRRIWMMWTNQPIFDQEGRLTEILAVGSDITSYKLAEEALKKSEAQFASVLENSIDIIYRRNLKKNQYDYISAAVHRILGFTPDEMKSMPNEAVFQRIHPDDIKTVTHRLAAVAKAGGHTLLEYRFKTRSGEYRWLADTIYVIRDERGKPLYRDGIVRDITEYKKTERKLKEINATLETRVEERTRELEMRAEQLQRIARDLSEAEEKVQQRIASILHDDLQQYLSALKFKLWEILPPDRIDQDVNNRLSEFEQLLNDSIQKTRRLTYELSPPILEQSGLLAAIEWLARDMREMYGLKVTLQLNPEAEPASSSIASVLYRAIRELLFNVIKHAGVDSASLDADCQDGWIQVRVADRGKGFDPDNEAKGKKMGGFGMLNLIERIKCLGGRVSIESRPGAGCRVTLHIINRDYP